MHVLHEICSLLLTLVNRFMKPECIAKCKVTEELLRNASKYIAVAMDKIECGSGVREALTAAFHSSVDVAAFCVRVRQAYVAH